MTDIIERLRSHPSRDNRSLLDEAADEIERLRSSKTAKWIKHTAYTGMYSCSLCSDCFIPKDWITQNKWNFCPQCGAKIDEVYA